MILHLRIKNDVWKMIKWHAKHWHNKFDDQKRQRKQQNFKYVETNNIVLDFSFDFKNNKLWVLILKYGNIRFRSILQSNNAFWYLKVNE